MRMTSSKSSPMLSVSRPPTSTRTSRRNMPKAPLISTSAPKRDQPVRPSMNARRYSTTWMRASREPGIRTCTIRPLTTRQPLAARIAPPVATVRIGSSANGFATPRRESGSRIESASTMATSGSAAALMPTLTASERPEFSLRTSTSRVRPLRGTRTSTTAARMGTSAGSARSTDTRSKAARSRSAVPSVLPSSTTTTSCRGYRRASMACTEVTMPASSLYAGTITDTPGASWLATVSSWPERSARRRWWARSHAAKPMSSRYDVLMTRK